MQEAIRYAQSGRFPEMLEECRPVLDDPDADVASLLDIGTLLSNFGFLSDARTCYTRAQTLDPTDLRATINLANLARDRGEHKASRNLYTDLLTRLPDHPVIRRNALTSLEYDPEVTDAEMVKGVRHD